MRLHPVVYAALMKLKENSKQQTGGACTKFKTRL